MDGRHPTEFGTSYSVSGMKSISANLVIFDEYDDARIGGADSATPFDMVLQRGQQALNPLAIFESTPGLDGESLIDDAFHRTDMRERYCGCIACGEGFLLELEVIHRLEDIWQIVCPACGYIYSEADRQLLITDEYSAWLSTNDAAPEEYRGYHINQFHSAVMSVDETMRSFREDAQQGFTTQVLARPYKREEIPSSTPTTSWTCTAPVRRHAAPGQDGRRGLPVRQGTPASSAPSPSGSVTGRCPSPTPGTW